VLALRHEVRREHMATLIFLSNWHTILFKLPIEWRARQVETIHEFGVLVCQQESRESRMDRTSRIRQLMLTRLSCPSCWKHRSSPWSTNLFCGPQRIIIQMGRCTHGLHSGHSAVEGSNWLTACRKHSLSQTRRYNQPNDL
jgi:hypothetical protein